MLLALGATATESQIVSELNLRNYYLKQLSQPSPLPSATQSQIIQWSVELNLQKQNLAPRQSSITTLDAMTWGNLIAGSIDTSNTLSAQYSVSGLSGLGATGLSWWDTYMPTILQVAGSAAQIWGTSWQTKVTREQISNQVAATTGIAIPPGAVGTQAQADAMALNFQQQGMSATEAQQRANNIVLGTPFDIKESGLPSWALPVGIAALAFMLLQRK